MMPEVRQVWLAVEPVDMRAGIDGLSLTVQEALGRSPCDGSAYAFRNRRGSRASLCISPIRGRVIGVIFCLAKQRSYLGDAR